jgi:predicted O-methyltransferase YrrM
MPEATDIKSFVTELMGSNPYDGFDASGYLLDITGWKSTHPYFEGIIAKTRPRSILEVGTWKGASAINMAKLARRHVPTAQVLCVDTWLGSHRALWMYPESRRQLNLKHGFPQQYFQFIANVVLSNLQDSIFPLPMTSYSATDILARSGLKFDVIYIDAHHDEDEVLSDIRRSFGLLRAGGTMFGDDYAVEEPGVIKAVNRFAADHGLYLNVAKEKWAVQKPVS